MNKRIRILAITALLISFIVPAGMAFAAGGGASYIVTEAYNTSFNIVRTSTQHSSFYADGKHWVIYLNTAGDLSYRSSFYGDKWSSELLIPTAIPLDFGANYDVVNNGTRVYLAYAKWTGLDNYNDLYYQYGEIQVNGTISWSDGQTVYNASDDFCVADPSIAVDSDGYPLIAYGLIDDNFAPWNCYLNVSRSTLQEGNWNTEWDQNLASDSSWSHILPSIVALDNGRKVYCFYTQKKVGASEIKSRYTDALGLWESEQVCSSNISTAYYSLFSATSSGDEVRLAFNVNNSYTINYSSCEWKEEWSAEDTISPTVQNNTTPVIVQADTGDLRIYWMNASTGNIYYNHMDSNKIWDDSPTLWLIDTDTISESYTIQPAHDGILYQVSGSLYIKYARDFEGLPSTGSGILSFLPFILGLAMISGIFAAIKYKNPLVIIGVVTICTLLGAGGILLINTMMDSSLFW